MLTLLSGEAEDGALVALARSPTAKLAIRLKDCAIAEGTQKWMLGVEVTTEAGVLSVTPHAEATSKPYPAGGQHFALRLKDPPAPDVPEDPERLARLAGDICSRCEGSPILFLCTANGPSREGGGISPTVTSWQCPKLTCDGEPRNMGGGLGVAQSAWDLAVSASPECANAETMTVCGSI